MRTPISFDQFDAVSTRFRGLDRATRTATAYEELAEGVPSGAHWNAGMALTRAGEYWGDAGQHERALECFERARQTGDEVPPDVRVFVIGGLLECARYDEADELATEIRNSKPTDPDVFALMGEAYSAAERLEEAHRWFTMGLVRCRDLASLAGVGLLAGRYGVRRALVLPVDDDDERFAMYLTEARRMLDVNPPPENALASAYLGRGEDGYDYTVDIVPA